MTTYTVEAPDKRHYTVEAPEGASEQQAIDWFKSQWQAGNVTPDQAIVHEDKSESDLPSFLDIFEAGFDNAKTDVNNASIWLESRYPLGTIGQSPAELYGEDFLKASPEERRVKLLEMRQTALSEEHKNVLESEEKDSLTFLAGEIFGMLASPTTLLPITKTFSGAALMGGAVGTEHTILQQLADVGEVKVAPTLQGTLVGTALGPVGLGLARGATKGGEIIKGIAQNKAAKKAAEETLDTVDSAIIRALADDTPIKDIPKVVQQATGVTKKTIQKAILATGRKPVIPTPKEAKILREIELQKAAPEVDPSILGNAKQKFTNTLDEYLGNISTRVKNISEEAFGRLREFEFMSHTRTYEALKKADPFIQGVKQLPKSTQTYLKKSLLNGDFVNARKALRQHSPNLESSFDDVLGMFDSLYTEMKDAGYDSLGKIDNYFPRFVLDSQRLQSKLGKVEQSLVTKALQDKAKSLGLNSIDSIPEGDKVDVINKVIRGYLPKVTEGGLRYSKARTIDTISDDLLPEYADIGESLDSYFRKTIGDLEKRKFFGRGNAVTKESDLSIEASIGNYVNRLRDDLTPQQLDDLTKLLQARFGPGEQTPSKGIRFLRDMGNMTTIANPYSAATQLGDLGVATYLNGMKNTLGAMFGKKQINMKELGLDQVIAAEFENIGKTAKALDWFFTKSGFRTMDRFGKNTVLNGALRKARALSKSTKGVANLRDKYGKSFGNEFDSLVQDLQNGRMSPNVKLYLWNELSDVQPISLSEMPQKYLEHPDGRIFYALKTFGIKQLDLLRRDIVNQYNKGNKKQAIINAGRYATIVPLMGATVDETKDFMLGNGFEVDDIPDNYMWNLLKTFGANEYVSEKYLGEGKLASAIANVAAPPVSWIDALGSDIMNIATGEDASLETTRELPLVGKFLYMFFGGGLEKEQEKELKEMFEE